MKVLLYKGLENCMTAEGMSTLEFAKKLVPPCNVGDTTT